MWYPWTLGIYAFTFFFAWFLLLLLQDLHTIFLVKNFRNSALPAKTNEVAIPVNDLFCTLITYLFWRVHKIDTFRICSHAFPEKGPCVPPPPRVTGGGGGGGGSGPVFKRNRMYYVSFGFNSVSNSLKFFKRQAIWCNANFSKGRPRRVKWHDNSSTIQVQEHRKLLFEKKALNVSF